MEVIGGDPAEKIQKPRRERRDVVEHVLDVAKFGTCLALGRCAHRDPGKAPAPERDEQPHAGNHEREECLRHAVGERPLRGGEHGNLDVRG